MTKSVLLLVLGVGYITCATAQLSDIISIRKKNGRVVKTLGAGSPVHFITTGGYPIDGYISVVKDDSVFITSYDIRSFPTRWGVYAVDTFATYLSGYAFRDIVKIRIREKKFSQVSIPRLMMIGAGAFFILNVVNGPYLDQPFGDPENLTTLGVSAGIFGAGVALQAIYRGKEYTGKRHLLKYIRLR